MNGKTARGRGSGGKASLVLMTFGNPQKDVPEGQMKIAQRFNAGTHATPAKVPKGRLNGHPSAPSFNRPFGTRIRPTTFPALKHRAIIEMSLRDKLPSNFRKALPPQPNDLEAQLKRGPAHLFSKRDETHFLQHRISMFLNLVADIYNDDHM